MTRFQRLQCHQLARVYYLRTGSVGSGKRRYVVLAKTINTSLVPLSESHVAISNILTFNDQYESPAHENGKKKHTNNLVLIHFKKEK